MCGPVDQINTSCLGAFTGSSRRVSWSRSVKMAVFAPIPRARESTATRANMGLRSRVRQASFRSKSKAAIEDSDARRAELVRAIVEKRGDVHGKQQEFEIRFRVAKGTE